MRVEFCRNGIKGSLVGIQQNLDPFHLIKLGNDDTVAARDVRTRGW